MSLEEVQQNQEIESSVHMTLCACTSMPLACFQVVTCSQTRYSGLYQLHHPGLPFTGDAHSYDSWLVEDSIEASHRKGAHTRPSLASESGWTRVPMSQTRPCVECHEPDFG
jgi:hypothetical protein